MGTLPTQTSGNVKQMFCQSEAGRGINKTAATDVCVTAFGIGAEGRAVFSTKAAWSNYWT